MISPSELESIFNAEFPNYLEPLSKISLDSGNNEIMINEQTRFFDYDKITGKVYKGENSPKSPDMIYFKNNEILFFEFKNGRIKSHEIDEIKLKAIEGGFIVLYKILLWLKARNKFENNRLNFPDVLNIDKTFVLVYNIKKNSRYYIHTHVDIKSNGLGMYKNTFFRRVKILSPDVIERWLKRRGTPDAGS